VKSHDVGREQRAERGGVLGAQVDLILRAVGMNRTVVMLGGLTCPGPTRLSASLYQDQPLPALYHQEEVSLGSSLIADWEGG
jgi:hypothetical protein